MATAERVRSFEDEKQGGAEAEANMSDEKPAAEEEEGNRPGATRVGAPEEAGEHTSYVQAEEAARTSDA